MDQTLLLIERTLHAYQSPAQVLASVQRSHPFADAQGQRAQAFHELGSQAICLRNALEAALDRLRVYEAAHALPQEVRPTAPFAAAEAALDGEACHVA